MLEYSLGWWLSASGMFLSMVLSLFNCLGLIVCVIKGRSMSFTPPFAAGVIGAIACALQPAPNLSSLFWVFLLVDPSIGFAMPSIFIKGLLNRIKANKH